MNTSNWLGLGTFLLTGVLAAVAAREAWQARESAKEASESRDQALTAAQRSAEAQAQAAAALERIGARLDESRSAHPWVVIAGRGAMKGLKNESNRTLRTVRMRSDSEFVRWPIGASRDQMPPGDAIEFRVVKASGRGQLYVDVDWVEEDLVTAGTAHILVDGFA